MLSIVVPTTRNISNLLESLEFQTSQDFEVLVQKEKGLVQARNAGIDNAKGNIVAFIDDDVELDENWVDEMVNSFSNDNIGGVMGGVITETGNRDNDWSNPIMAEFFRKLDVQACNMAFRRNVLDLAGGFDKAFTNGVGEWSEPDLVFEVKRLGYRVITNPKALLWHYPSPEGIYTERAKHSYWRMKNFMLFRKRWLKWDVNLFLVFSIFTAYWVYKFLKTGKVHWLGGIRALW